MEQELIKLCMGCMASLEDAGNPCPVCGYRADSPCNVDYITPATILGERYIIGKLISFNAESAVYMGFDKQENAKVMVREFAPEGITKRNHVSQNLLVKGERVKEYKEMLDDFCDMATHLMKVQKGEAIIPITDLIKTNNTAYLVYPYAHMLTIDEFLSRSGGTTPWHGLKKLMMPLLSSLARIHQKGIVHRGICPENILIDTKGGLWLWGFATMQLRSHSSTYSFQLYEGYSAPEQYYANSWHGDWTDVYAVAAVLYKALTGTRPPEASGRKHNDNLLPPCEMDSAVPQNVSQAIVDAMAVSVEKRTQTVDEFSARLLENVMGNTAVFTRDMPAKTPSKDTVATAEQSPQRNLNFVDKLAQRYKMSQTTAYTVVAMAATFVLVAGGLVVLGNADIFNLSKGSSSSEEETSVIVDTRIPTPSFEGMFIDTLKRNEEYFTQFAIEIIESYNDAYPKGVVVAQTPLPDALIEPGGAITIEVSKGPETVPMPALEGSTLAFAMETLTRLGIQYDIIEIEDEAAEADKIIRTDKEVGAGIRKYKDKVTLFVKKTSSDSSSEEEDSDYD